MPGFDGTGPRGKGPMTGRAEGSCAVVLPSSEDDSAPYGYAGLQGTPGAVSKTSVPFWRRFFGRAGASARAGRALRRGRRGR
jgi:hypothetical protein